MTKIYAEIDNYIKLLSKIIYHQFNFTYYTIFIYILATNKAVTCEGGGPVALPQNKVTVNNIVSRIIYCIFSLKQ